MKYPHPRLRLLLLALSLPSATWAVDKENNTINLDQGESWVGGVAPSAAQTAVWTNAVTSANSVQLGSDATWGGIQIGSPGGLVTIGTGNVLTLGASGIDMTSATQSLALDCSLTLGAPQSWTIASGRALAVSGSFENGGNNLTITGNAASSSDVAVAILSGAFSGAGNLTKGGLGILSLGGIGTGVNVAMNAGTVIQIDGGTMRNFVGSTGSWTGNLSSLKVASGATFDVGDTNTVVDTLSGVGAGFGVIQKSGTASATLTIGANNGSDTFAGPIRRLGGVFTLSKIGTGTQTIAGSSENDRLLVEVKSGTLVLSKPSTGAGLSSIGRRAAWGVTDIAAGATLQFGTAGTGGEQIYGFGEASSSIAGTGSVVMSGGTLDFNGKSEGWNILSGSGTVRNNLAGTTSVMTLGQDSGSGTFSGAIIDGVATGIMALTKTGTGRLTLTGNSNTYTGATLVSRGILEITGTLTTTAITVNNNTSSNSGTLAGEGTVGNVTFGPGTPGPGILVNPSTPGSMTMAAVTINGTVNVSLSNSNFTLGSPFKVLGYTSKGNGWTTANFALQGATNYRGSTFTDVANAVNVSISASNIEWTNASGDSIWNTNGSVNFRDGVPSDQKCYYFDSIIFGNLPGANQTITVNGPQVPSSLTVNSTHDYTFNNGTLGAINGATGLLKSGSGTLTMNLSNGFTGATTITGGILAIFSDAALGAVPGSYTPAAITLNGGTLRMNGAFMPHANRGITLGAAGGTLDTISAGTTTLLSVSTQVSGNGPLTLLANGDVNDFASGAGALSLIAGNPFTGDVKIAAGLVTVESDFGSFTNPVILDGGGLIDQGTNFNFTRNLKIGAAGGYLRAYTNTTNTEFSGSMENAPGVSQTTLRHIEGGTIRLTGSGAGFTGTYTNARGSTQISATDANWENTNFVADTNGAASSLIFNGTGTAKVKSITSARDVILNDGTTLDVSALTLATNAHYYRTLTGTLGSLTSSTGTLTVTNGAATGSLTTLDHQIQVPIKDVNGSTPLTLIKNNNNTLVLSQPNSYTGGTIIQLGRLHAPVALSYGTGMVTVNSGGQAYLTTAGLTYANAFTLNGIGIVEAAGTLGALRFENNTVSGAVTVASASRMTAFAAATIGTITGPLLGSADLEKTGSGTINLNGDAAGYTGTLTAAQGTLNLNSATLGGSLALAASATLNTESTVAGNITLGTTGTSTLLFNPATTAALTATGTLAVNGTVSVGLNGAIPASGTYKVLGFGAKSGTWSAANFSLAGSYRPGTAFTENANEVTVTITKIPLTWTNGAANSVWDTNLSFNFRDVSLTAQKFYSGDDVTFSDVPGSAQTIAINGNQQPSSVTVDSPFNYTFNAGTGGVISGATGLLKAGAGTLSINLANTFSGGVTIRQGELRTGNNTAAGTGTMTLGDAGTGASNVSWLFNGSGTPSHPVVVSALGTGTVTIGTYSAGFATPSCPLQLNRAVTLIDATGDRTTFTGKISGNVGTITLAGNRVTFDNATNDFVGNIVVSAGTIYQNNGSTVVPDSTNFTLMSSTSRFRLNNFSEVIGAISGTGVIENIIGSGNTLTVGGGNGSGTFSGQIINGSGVLNIAKIGTGTQVFNGTTTHTGSTTVSAGTLQMPTSTTATGACTVADGATLAIAGNTGTSWKAQDMTLGTTTGATLKIRNFGSLPNSAPLEIMSGGLTVNGTVTIEVSGVFEVGSYPLIYLPSGSSVGGGGFSSLVLGALPVGVSATLQDGGDQIILNVTASDKLTWNGNLSSEWDINATSNWVFGASPAKYLDGSDITFTDAATGSTNVVLSLPVAPANVTFNHSTKNYTLSGSGNITGGGGLTKRGSGSLVMTNAHSYTGLTSVNEGTLQLGNGTVNGSISGDLTNNGTVIFHPATAQTYAGALSGTTGTMTKEGAQTMTLTGGNSYTGSIQVNAGIWQIGNGSTNGSIGTSNYTIASGARLFLNYATATPGGSGQWSSKISGAGTLQLRSAQGANGTANWGPNSEAANAYLPGFTGTVQVDNGRLDSSPAGLGGISKIIINNGAQFLAWSGTYAVPVEIAGNGWGEAGYPSALRVAAAYNATWAGPITLTANAGILSQDGNSVFTLTGTITGPFECDFIRVGNIFVTPAAAVRNSYGSTKISSNGGTGIVTAGNANAFSPGGLLMNGGTVALNGFSFDFASLSGSSGEIRNNSATACVMTVGSGNGTSTFAATMVNGSTGTLGLAKTGTGTQIITSSTNTYSGGTTIHQGVLQANNASGSATGSGAIVVNSTGTFGGTGFITGAVTVNSGGSLAPGAPIESLATGALTLAAGSTYAVEINSSGTPAADVTNAGGNVSLAGSLVVSDIASVPVALPLGTKFTIMTYAGTRTGTFAGLAEAATIAAGPNTFRIRYADGSAVTLEAVAGVTNPFTLWSTANGVTGGMNGDDDGDGVKNILEYATNSNPNAATGGGSSGPRCYPLLFTIGAEQALTYTMAVRKNAVFTASGNQMTATKDQVKYTIQGSNNLADWTTVAISEVTGADATNLRAALGSKLTSPPIGADWEWRTFRTDGGAPNDPSDFIRLHVEEAAP